MDASILICTRNRAASLQRTLESLTALRIAAATTWEVIVVDNASTDGTPAVIAAFAGRLPIRRVVEPIAGLSRARNMAVRHASGGVLLFTDDDCLVAPDWVATALRLLQANPLQLIGGRIELFDPEALPLAVRTSTDREVLRHYSNSVGFIHGANLAFGRGVLDVVGPFDVRLGPGSATGSGEDADFVYRVLCAGMPVVYEPALLVHHDHGRKGRAMWYRQVGEHAQGFGAMAAKYLVRGDVRPLRTAYWDFRATVRMFGHDRREWRRVAARLRVISGFFLYYAART